jgi:Uma2 family endonuclease
MAVALKVPTHMTVAEFLDWSSGDSSGTLWQLRDGEPEMVASVSDAHESIQDELHRLIENHLVSNDGWCRSVITPGVVPRLRSDRNMLIPDIGVTCGLGSGGRSLPNPVLLVGVMSPLQRGGNAREYLAYTTIPSLQEIIIISSTERARVPIRQSVKHDPLRLIHSTARIAP